MKHIVKNIFLFFLCAVLAMACGKKAPDENSVPAHAEKESDSVEVTPEQFETAGILLGKVEKKQISGTIKVNGILDAPPQQVISISAPLGGFLKNTELLQGSRVKKGQVLASIENLDFIQIQQDYIEARNQFEFAEADYERQQRLAKENVNSEKVLQQSKTNFISWQTKFKGLREKLEVLNINVPSVEQGDIKSFVNLYSPINGYVTQVNVNIGKFVNPTDVLFVIIDTEHLHAELIVFEKDVPRLKIGQKVRFTLANERKERTATIYLIGREISSDRTIRIHCHLDQEDKELLPGMYLMAVVETEGSLVPVLPDEAVIVYQGKKYIFVSTGENAQRFAMVEIQTGNSELSYTEVTLPGDMDDNTQVAVKGAYALLSKMKNAEEVE